MQTTIERENAERVNSQSMHDKRSTRLRRQAEEHGIPVFMLRLAASRRVALCEAETTLRYRHD